MKAIVSLLLAIVFASSVQARDFMTISPLYDSAGKPLSELGAGQHVSAYVTVKSNAKDITFTLGRVKVIGLSGIYTSETEDCVHKVLPPEQEIRCDMVLTPGVSMPDTTSKRVQTEIELADKVNRSVSDTLKLSVVASRTASLEVVPRMPFEEVYQQEDVGSEIVARAVFVLKNAGDKSISINDIAFDKRKEFDLLGAHCTGVVLKPGGGNDSQCIFSSNFTSSTPGQYADNLVITAKQGDQSFTDTLPQNVQVFLPAEKALQLRAEQPFKQQIIYPNVQPTPVKAVYRITNVGDSLKVKSVSLSNYDGRFIMDNPDACKGNLPQGESCQVELTFSSLSGDEPAIYSDRLVVNSADTPDPIVLSPLLAVKVLGAASWQVDPGDVDSKLAIPVDKSQASDTLSATLINTGLTDIDITQDDGIHFTQGQAYYAVIDDNCGDVLPVGQACSIHYRVTATDSDVSKSPLLGRLEVTGMADGKALEPAIQTISTTVEKEVAPVTALKWVDKKPLPTFVKLDDSGDALGIGDYQLVNQGNQPIQIDRVDFTMPYFSLHGKSNTCTGATLNPNDSCDAGVLFVSRGNLVSEHYSSLVIVGYHVQDEPGRQSVALLSLRTLQAQPALAINSSSKRNGFPRIFAYRQKGHSVTGTYKVTNISTSDIQNLTYSVGPRPDIQEIVKTDSKVSACRDTHTLKFGDSCLVTLRLTPDSRRASYTVPVFLSAHGNSHYGLVDRGFRFGVKAIDARASVGYLRLTATKPFAKTLPPFTTAEAEYSLTNHWLLTRATLGKIGVTNPYFHVIDTNHCSGKTLGYHQSCTIKVRFSSEIQGRYLNQLLVPVQWLHHYIAGSALMYIKVSSYPE